MAISGLSSKKLLHVTMADQQQQQMEEQRVSTTPPRRRQRAPPMPSDDIIRNSIASSLTQILVNMQNGEYQQKCRELLQVEDLTQGAHIKILATLEQIDGEREQRERTAKERRQRRENKEN